MKKRVHSGEVTITHVKRSGPGGQHRNKRLTGIRLRHDSTGVVVEASERRSQSQNLARAFERLENKLELRSRRRRPRRASGPSHFERERRRQEKSLRSRAKKMRGRVKDSE